MNRLSLGFAAACAMLSLAPQWVGAQTGSESATGQANRLVRDAVLYASRGDTAAALDQLKRAIQLAPGLADAHYRRGMYLARQAGNGMGDMFKRRAAGAALDRAIRIESGNPNYYLELGRLRLKQGVFRLDAARLFNRAINAARERGDPAVVAEVAGELGDIFFRRYQAVGHRRMVTGNAFRFDPEAAAGDPHYTRNFLSQQTSTIEDAGELDLRQAEERYREGVASWPMHDASTAGLLGILYDGERYEEFHEVARNFVRAAPANARAHLFSGLGLWRLGRAREASRRFDRALDLMTPAERVHVTDLSTIMRQDVANRYQRLTSAERTEFDRVYWSVNDPLKLTPENEHMLEHMARVAYTDIRYSAPDLHLRGWETDQGVIYIRYGPPPVIASFPPGTGQIGGVMEAVDENTPPSSTGDLGATGRVTTVWFYPERNLRFVFYGTPGYNFARFAGEFRAYAEDARYAVPVKYDNVPVNDALDSVAIQVAQFRSVDASPATELVLYAGLPLRRMAGDVDLDQGPLESGLFISDLLERSIVAERRNETVEFNLDRQFEQRTFQSLMEPGEYRYRVEARQPTTRRAARGASRLTVEAFDRPHLMLSDVVLADRVAPRVEEPEGRRSFFVDPNPAMSYAPGAEVHLYWEMYNLEPDSTGAVRYEAEAILRVQSLERRGFAANIIGGLMDAIGTTAKGDDQVSLRYSVSDVLGERDRLPGWVALDLDEAPSGVYTLRLIITDLNSGKNAVRSRTFLVTEPETR